MCRTLRCLSRRTRRRGVTERGAGAADPRARPPRRLDEGEGERRGDLPPLVALDEVEEGTDLVFEDLLQLS